MLDGAHVIEWVGRDEPFYELDEGGLRHRISNLAIAQYRGGQWEWENTLYLFGCDAEWEVQSDIDCVSINDAKRTALYSHAVPIDSWQPMSCETDGLR